MHILGFEQYHFKSGLNNECEARRHALESIHHTKALKESLRINKNELVHSSHEPVDEDLSVAMVTPLDEVPSLLPEATTGRAELERPHKVVGLLEMGPHREELMDQVLHANDAIPTKSLYVTR